MIWLRVGLYAVASLGLLGGVLFLWMLVVLLHDTSWSYLRWLLSGA